MPATHGTHWMEREDFGDVTVVRFKVPKLLDDDTIRALFDPIGSLVQDVKRTRLVLNLQTVQFLPSLAIGKLVLLNRRIQAAGGRLALCCLGQGVAQILETTSLLDLFNVYDDEPEAVGSFT